MTQNEKITSSESENEEIWYTFLTRGLQENPLSEPIKAVFDALPHDPRCMFCHSPFSGYGGRLMRLIGRDQSMEDPRFCNSCIKYGQKHPGGAFVDLAVLFADVRGSTPLAESLGDREFSNLINRFYEVSSRSLIKTGALVNRFAGDEASGFFVPGLAGSDFIYNALECAQLILKETGHGEPDGPWLPLGVSLHAGNAYVGMVGTSANLTYFTALGDDINVGARIASAAAAGEILASLAFCRKAGIETHNLEHRNLTLKGKQEPMEAAVIPLHQESISSS